MSKAAVDTPTTLYSNVTVELVSDDDVEMTVTIRNRQGVVLRVLRGDSWRREGAAWIVDLEDGAATITVMGGCGCGGSSVEDKTQGGDMLAGILP